MKRIIVAALAAVFTLSIQAQQVNTLYFMENAPMRHTINPAFQPVSNGFINFTPLGWTTIGFGNNSLTLSDIFFVDPVTGNTITPLHPNADKQAFLNRISSMTLINGEMTFGLLNFGFRIKENGYFTFGVNERIELGNTLPKSLFSFAFGGGMRNLEGINTIALSGLGMRGSLYAEISGGYSHRINEKWTVGGKLKILLGQAYGGFNARNLNIDASTKEWRIHGTMGVDFAGPVNTEYLASFIDGKSVGEIYTAFTDGTFDKNQLINTSDYKALARQLLKPSGIGAAIDLGFVYKPIEMLQLNVGLTDLGFIYWNKANTFTASVDTVFTGVGEIEYNDPKYRDEEGNFSSQKVLDEAVDNLKGLLNGVNMKRSGVGAAKMASARLNVGLDANFWDNRVGVGIVSATRLYNARLYEELTLGAAFRPFNWLSLALSYSLMNNGKYSNIGAGLSIMPYDGINLTLAMDYIPTSYAALPNGNDPTAPKKYLLPDKAKMVNVALGFSIVWGTNHRDKDKDGVIDKLDMCPNTPRGVVVDEKGCPVDEDKDGVPDYLDKCPGTPSEAIGYVDENGCPLDSDGDKVPDYLDKCPNTPEEALGKVDEFGCPKDTDGDGVPDYLDECPNTPVAAQGKVDEKGCPKDTDGDGVPDYLDECPNTPAEAISTVNEHGCAKDTDGDGVEDYMDKCPDTPAEARGKVDEFGCPLDEDKDGVPDYIDHCPGTPEEARGTVDKHGCPIDSDGDGVADYKDKCPNTPKKAIGFVDEFGCPKDTDGDGILDYEDECPTVPGVKANKGCPEIKREVRQLLQKAMQGIEFETGKSTIKPKSYPLLNQIADIFIENKNYIIEVQGHTDNVGKEDYNMRLSDQRANAVMKYLLDQGVPAERMSAHGYGLTRPIADNKTAAGRQKNRRVEFKITFEEVHVETILDHADKAPEAPEAEEAEKKEE